MTDTLRNNSGLVLWLTGAGISAESGIPTFRGEEGYWRVGSRNYRPQQMATRAAFDAMPEEVWSWYLYRRGVCRAAAPNAAHLALADLEQRIGDRFCLATQNVDGLHLRAGNSLERTFQIHGNIDFMRCVRECDGRFHPLPEGIATDWDKSRRVTDEELGLLRCASCGAPGRPHVLWFDESYDEARYRWESSVRAATEASILIIVGTTGGTSLPAHIASIASQRRTPIVVVNPEPNPFFELAENSGMICEGTAGDWVPQICAQISAQSQSQSQ